MKQLIKVILSLFAICLFLTPLTSYAAANTGEMSRYPNVTLSPDGSKRAWTTDLWDVTDERGNELCLEEEEEELHCWCRGQEKKGEKE